MNQTPEEQQMIERFRKEFQKAEEEAQLIDGYIEPSTYEQLEAFLLQETRRVMEEAYAEGLKDQADYFRRNNIIPKS
jgi:hypothetical protein